MTREPDFAALRLELSRLRHARGWTYEVLAEKSGVSRRTLIAVETGESNGALETWFRVATAFDVDLGDLARLL